MSLLQPIQLLSLWMGVDLALGSAGWNGKEALEKVIEWLKRGRSIQVNLTPDTLDHVKLIFFFFSLFLQIPVDGPYGPAHQLKPGVSEAS